MNVRKELFEIPGALQQMREEGLPLYDALVRRVSWSEKPVFILGDGPSYPAALSGAWAFESLLGVPVVVERPGIFTAYTSRTLAPRSLVIVLADPHGGEETLAAARKARSHGAIVWAITPDSASELAASADGAISDYSGGPAAEGGRAVFCRYAAMLFLAASAARVLKAHGKSTRAQEEDLAKIGVHVDWVLNQISDAAGALAKEMAPLPGVYVTGGGAFFPVALQAASRLRQVGNFPALGFELLDFEQSCRQISQPGSGILYLSSSRCGLRSQAHQSVREMRQQGNRKIFAVTDGNDRPLADRADIAILLPVLTEAGSALLTLVFLELVASYAHQTPLRPSTRRQAAKP
ncbi:MAG: SIS domain-containing protein [Acidobacteria bacterium]|nr:MAG: SIS domain-containing protein [Acidobacteriota bacterium]